MSGHPFDPHTLFRELPSDLRKLAEQIHSIQARLNSPSEQPEDLDTLQKTAHTYMNRLTEYYAARQLSTPPFLIVYQQTHRTP